MPRYRFGLYEFDSDKGELFREGVPVKLQRQPAQALGILLARPGEVVSREVLRDAVWGTETFVDFENGLNYCIAQVRSALRDSAESPRYVRTVPRKGYQFVAPVTVISDTALQSEPELIHPAAPARTARPHMVLLLAVAVASSATYWLLQRTPSSSFQQAPAVAVFRLDNNTGDPQYDRLAEVLTDSLVADLTEAGQRSGPAAYAVIGNDALLLRARSQRDLAAVGAKLGTSFTISGSIRAVASSTNGKVEVFAQLITLPDQRHRKVIRVELSGDAVSAVPPEVPRRIVETFDPVIRATKTPL